MTNKLHDADTLAQALAEPSRRALLEKLRMESKTVSELVAATGLKQPNVSNHLAKMRTQGLVRADRHGRHVYYSLITPYADVLMRMHELVAAPHYEADNAFVSQHDDTAVNDSEEAMLVWRDSYLEALIQGDEERAAAVISALLSHKASMKNIYMNLFEWCLYKVGEMYQSGRIDVAHEHMASAITERMMYRVSQYYRPQVRTHYRAVLGNVQGNWHTVGLRMLADALRQQGWETVYLGANVPESSFISLVKENDPDLVVISCSMQEQIPDLGHLLAGLGEELGKGSMRFQVAVGGHVLQQLGEFTGLEAADFYSNNLVDFLQEVQLRFPVEYDAD